MIYHLSNEQYLDQGEYGGFRFTLFRGSEDTCLLHCHDFYEIFFVLRGEMCHFVNDENFIYEKNTVCFVRPGDCHRHFPPKNKEGESYELFNMAFSAEKLEEMSKFFDVNAIKRVLIDPKNPISVRLDSFEADNLKDRFYNIFTGEPGPEKKNQFRIIMINLMERLVSGSPEKSNYIPLWLSELCEKLNDVSVFTMNVRIMSELSHYSYVHIRQSFVKYLKIKPTTYLNNLRLNYAEQLLANSNLPILDVCLNCGFESQSYFGTLFKEKNGLTPTQWREKHQKSII